MGGGSEGFRVGDAADACRQLYARAASCRHLLKQGKGGRSSRPKRPGRKPGMGSFSYRKSPSPDEVTEPLVEVAVAENTCPGCGGRLAALYCLLDGVIRHPFLLVAARQLNGNQEDVRRQRAWEALRGENSLHDCKRIPYWIDRRLTDLAGPEYDAIISFGLPSEPENSQYGKSRVDLIADLVVID